MSRKLMIPALLLALVMLCACGSSGSEGGVYGRNMFFTRAASDEEAFRDIPEDEVYIHDDAVPLTGLPASTGQREGWILLRYAENDDGAAEPLWYRVWTAAGSWSQEIFPYEGSGWHPTLPAPDPLG